MQRDIQSDMKAANHRRSSLDALSIKALGVIESAYVEFSPGFTAITGETGAGKTMVLTALGLVTGAKADGDYVRSTAERSIVSAEFSVSESLQKQLEDIDALVENGSLGVTRSLTKDGKSRISIGGVLSSTSKANEISELLIEIHGQSTSQRLNKASTQREILDDFASNSSARYEYEIALTRYRELESLIKILRKESSTAQEQIDKLKSFTEEFSKIMPQSGELDEIENELTKLGSVEEIHSQLSLALNLLENDDTGTLNNLKGTRKALEVLLGKDLALDTHIEKFADLIFTVEDVASELISYLARLEADPKRFDYLQQRKADINRLIKRFGIGSDRVAAFEQMIRDYEDAEKRIADLSGGSERIAELEDELTRVFDELRIKAINLSEIRKKAAFQMGQMVTAELSDLSMPHARLEVRVKQYDEHDISNYSSSGIDDIVFMFSPHSGAEPLALAKIASGGEVSRLMLALELVVAENSPIGTYIFDEVDAGVGGKAAIDIGKRLARLALHSQVIVVTHLPQVAVWADHHLLVHKDQSGAITESSVIQLDSDSRLREIARMLAGQEDSEIAQEHAKELVQMVKDFVIS